MQLTAVAPPDSQQYSQANPLPNLLQKNKACVVTCRPRPIVNMEAQKRLNHSTNPIISMMTWQKRQQSKTHSPTQSQTTYNVYREADVTAHLRHSSMTYPNKSRLLTHVSCTTLESIMMPSHTQNSALKEQNKPPPKKVNIQSKLEHYYKLLLA